MIGYDIAAPRVPVGGRFRHVTHDVCRSLEAAFVREGIDAAVHLAFVLGPARNRGAARRTNLQGTRQFLQAVRDARVPRAVVLSSATAYGARPDNPARLTEDAPLRADRSYAYSHDKRVCDEMCAAFVRESKGTALSWCRAPVVLAGAVDNYISRFLFKPKVMYARGCDPAMQFIHVEDLCAAVTAMLEAGVRGPYNASPEDALRFTSLAAEFKRAPMAVPAGFLYAVCGASYALRLKWLNEAPAGALAYIRYPWVIDPGRLARETGFRCARSSVETVRCWRREIVEAASAGRMPAGKLRV